VLLNGTLLVKVLDFEKFLLDEKLFDFASPDELENLLVELICLVPEKLRVLENGELDENLLELDIRRVDLRPREGAITALLLKVLDELMRLVFDMLLVREKLTVSLKLAVREKMRLIIRFRESSSISEFANRELPVILRVELKRLVDENSPVSVGSSVDSKL
jgi:hypothetical protein